MVNRIAVLYTSIQKPVRSVETELGCEFVAENDSGLSLALARRCMFSFERLEVTV